MTPEELARLHIEEQQARSHDEFTERFNRLDDDSKADVAYFVAFMELLKHLKGSSQPSGEAIEAGMLLIHLLRAEAKMRQLKFLWTEIIPACGSRDEVIESLQIGHELQRRELNSMKDRLEEYFDSLGLMSTPKPKHEPEVENSHES